MNIYEAKPESMIFLPLRNTSSTNITVDIIIRNIAFINHCDKSIYKNAKQYNFLPDIMLNVRGNVLANILERIVIVSIFK